MRQNQWRLNLRPTDDSSCIGGFTIWVTLVAARGKITSGTQSRPLINNLQSWRRCSMTQLEWRCGSLLRVCYYFHWCQGLPLIEKNSYIAQFMFKQWTTDLFSTERHVKNPTMGGIIKHILRMNTWSREKDIYSIYLVSAHYGVEWNTSYFGQLFNTLNSIKQRINFWLSPSKKFHSCFSV